MFTDPQSVTYNGNAKSMPKVESTGKQSVYISADGNFTMKISHQVVAGGRVRSLVRIDQRAVVADPLTADNDYQVLTTYMVIERPEYGFTATDVNYQVAALEGWIDSTSVGKLFGLES